MNIRTYPLGQLQANCYFISHEDKCLIIDPGDSADFILEELMYKNINVVGILATHGHFDHIMAVGELQLSLNIPFYIHDADKFLVDRMVETAQHYLEGEPQSLPPVSMHQLYEGKMTIDDFSFNVIHTPGHTPGSCCFYFEEDKYLFTGDTVFEEGIGDYQHSYSSKEDLFNSIHKIHALPPDVELFPGHGDSILLGERFLAS